MEVPTHNINTIPQLHELKQTMAAFTKRQMNPQQRNHKKKPRMTPPPCACITAVLGIKHANVHARETRQSANSDGDHGDHGFVTDRFFRKQSLVDTGAEASVIPPGMTGPPLQPISIALQAANHRKITTYGNH